MINRVCIALLLAVCACPGSLGQASAKTTLSKQCEPMAISRPLPKGPFHTLPNESLKNSPLLKFQINEDGTVTNVRLLRGSGVSDIDKQEVAYVLRWKYKPRPQGCGVLELEMSINIDLE